MRHLKHILFQLALWFDQGINIFVFIEGEGFGFADEALSARIWRHRKTLPRALLIVNSIFFWQINHCKESFESEQARKHLPKEYRDG